MWRFKNLIQDASNTTAINATVASGEDKPFLHGAYAGVTSVLELTDSHVIGSIWWVASILLYCVKIVPLALAWGVKSLWRTITFSCCLAFLVYFYFRTRRAVRLWLLRRPIQPLPLVDWKSPNGGRLDEMTRYIREKKEKEANSKYLEDMKEWNYDYLVIRKAFLRAQEIAMVATLDAQEGLYEYQTLPALPPQPAAATLEQFRRWRNQDELTRSVFIKNNELAEAWQEMAQHLGKQPIRPDPLPRWQRQDIEIFFTDEKFIIPYYHINAHISPLNHDAVAQKLREEFDSVLDEKGLAAMMHYFVSEYYRSLEQAGMESVDHAAWRFDEGRPWWERIMGYICSWFYGIPWRSREFEALEALKARPVYPVLWYMCSQLFVKAGGTPKLTEYLNRELHARLGGYLTHPNVDAISHVVALFVHVNGEYKGF